MAKQSCFTLVGLSDYGKTTLFYVSRIVRLWQNNLVLRWSECQTKAKQLFCTKLKIQIYRILILNLLSVEKYIQKN